MIAPLMVPKTGRMLPATAPTRMPLQVGENLDFFDVVFSEESCVYVLFDTSDICLPRSNGLKSKIVAAEFIFIEYRIKTPRIEKNQNWIKFISNEWSAIRSVFLSKQI